RTTSFVSCSTARSCAFVSTSAPPGCRFWSLSACAATGRRCCSASRTWAERARRPGGHFWTVWTPAASGSPELAIVDGAPGLERALAALWPQVPVQRCTVHKHRNLLAHAPKKLHDELSADYTDMIYARTVKEVDAKRKAFACKWRLKCQAVVDSLDEAGPRLFTFLRYPPEQWKSIRTTNAIERLHEEFKRRIKTQCLLPCAETACMLFWALLASGQIALRRVNGWDTFHVPPAEPNLDLVA